MKNLILILLLIRLSVIAQAQTVADFEFDSVNWILPEKSQIVEFQGKQSLLIERTADDSLKGYYATVKTFNFKDGVIEFDMFCPQKDNSYVGFLFRLTNYNEDDRYELFYFRPFQTNEIGAVQYMPVNNGAINWPDYNHDAYKSDGDIPWNEWVHVKANIKDSKATVYVNDNVVMTVSNLARGRTVGKVGLWLGNTTQCYYSNFKMTVDPALSGRTKDGEKVYASSVEYDGTLAGYAFDSNLFTRWSSNYKDPQWIMIDLLEIQKVGGVILKWEAAYAKGYEIRVSQDSLEWTTVFSTTTGNGATDKIIFEQIDARYVMMYGTIRGTVYGYSIYEFEVYENLISSIPENIVTDHFTTIYPNPASDIVNIKSSYPVETIEIYDALGNKTTISPVNYSENNIQLKINDLSKGIYFLRIKADNKVFSQKLIIE